MYKKKLFVLVYFISCIAVFAQEISDTEKDEKGNYKNESTSTNTSNSTIADVKITEGIQRVRDSIFILKGRGGNIGISVGQDGIFMIDDQFAEDSQSNIKKISSISKKPIRLLVNTHHHGDHVGGNANLSEKGAIIFAHQNVRKNMMDPYMIPAITAYEKKIDSVVSGYGNKITTDESRKSAYMEAEKVLGTIDDQINIPVGILPIVSITQDLTIYFNGEKIMLIHLPKAHTDGDIMVYFTKSNVLHTGDAFVNGKYPFIDTNSRGSHYGYISGLDKILGLVNGETKIIPGHGNIATIEDVQYTRSMYRFLTEQISYFVIDKKTEAHVVAMSELTKEYDDKGFGEGFITTEKFIQSLYNEIANKYRK